MIIEKTNTESLSGNMLAMLEGDFIEKYKKKLRPISTFSGAASSTISSPTKTQSTGSKSGSANVSKTPSISVAPSSINPSRLQVLISTTEYVPGGRIINNANDNPQPNKGYSRIIDKPLMLGATRAGSQGGSVPIPRPSGGEGSGSAYGGGTGSSVIFDAGYDAGIEIYPEKQNYQKYFRQNKLRKIPLKHILNFNELQAVGEYLRGIVVDSELLGADEVMQLNDAELLGFLKKIWKGIKKVGKGIWKGVKGVGKFVGKIGKGAWNVAKKVGTGVWNVAKKVGTGLFDAAKWVGKNLWQGVKKLGSGILTVSKFVFDNALPILKGVVSLFPGGTAIASLLDVLTQSSSSEQVSQVQYPQVQYPQEQYPQAQYPQEQYPQVQYPQEQYPQMQNIPQEQYIPEEIPQEEYSIEEINEPVVYVDENGNYLDESGNQLFVDESSNLSYEDGTQLSGNVFKKTGNWLQKKVIDPVLKTVKDPVKSQTLIDKIAILNKSRIETDAKLKQAGLNAQTKYDAWTEQSKVSSTGESFLQGYGLWLIVGAAALMLIVSK